MADVFRGNNLTRVDEKGRLKLPADFKRVIDAKFGEGAQFYITSLDGKRAQLYPIKEWESREALLATLAPSHPVRQKYQDAAAYFGAPAEMDSQGRLLLPTVLREQAKLAGEEVVVLGKAGKLEPGFLEVANHELFKEERRLNPLTQEDMAALAALGL